MQKVLFYADIKGSTTLSYRLGSVRYAKVIEGLYSKFKRLIQINNGKLLSFAGDCFYISLDNVGNIQIFMSKISDLVNDETSSIRYEHRDSLIGVPVEKRLIKLSTVIHTYKEDQISEVNLNSSQEEHVGYPMSITAKADERLSPNEIALSQEFIDKYNFTNGFKTAFGVRSESLGAGNTKFNFLPINMLRRVFGNANSNEPDSPGMRPGRY